MKITILAYGSRGDIQPFIALADGLQKKGHEVELAAPHRFTDLVGAYNIPFVPLAGDPEEISRRINDAGTNVVRVVSSIRDYVFSIAPQVSRSAFQACEGADLLIHSFLFTVGAHSWAREHSIPDVSVEIFPMFVPTREFPNVTMTKLPPGILSYLSHWLAKQIFWYGGNLGYGQARYANPDIPFPEKLYWPFDDNPLHPQTPVLCAWSPSVLPRPKDWPSDVHVTGYFFLEADRSFQPPIELQNFLDAGKPPVCISFGSMVNRKAKKIDQIIRDALAKTGQRGIILSGWSHVAHQPSTDIYYCDAIPHDWLLPRCKMIVHHGGAGTTSAGLRAGIPNIVVPFTADQPFWGSRVYALGAGPEPLLVRKLSVENITRAILDVDNQSIHKCVQDLGQKIRSEDGVSRAIELIVAHASQFKTRTIF